MLKNLFGRSSSSSPKKPDNKLMNKSPSAALPNAGHLKGLSSVVHAPPLDEAPQPVTAYGYEDSSQGDRDAATPFDDGNVSERVDGVMPINAFTDQKFNNSPRGNTTGAAKSSIATSSPLAGPITTKQNEHQDSSTFHLDF